MDPAVTASTASSAPAGHASPSAEGSLSWPALDGLRAFAVLSVLARHAGGVLPCGYLGVDVFFVLSGFLITSLLIGEWDRRGAVSFRAFYARRALRLLPALACVVGVSAVIAGLLNAAGGTGGHIVAAATFGMIPWVAAFVGNWHCALSSSTASILLPTWSLAVEEQFYFLWPALLVLLLRRSSSRTRVAASLTVLAVADTAYRAAMAHAGYSQDRIGFGTDTHCDGLLLGCAVAFWLTSGRARVPGWLGRGAAWLSAAVLAVLFVTGKVLGLSQSAQITIAVLASTALIIAVAADVLPAPLHRLLCAGWAQRIGRRSYGLYLWQFPVLIAVLALAAHWSAIIPAGGRYLVLAGALGLGAAACFPVAEASYRFVESPALRLKRRFHT